MSAKSPVPEAIRTALPESRFSWDDADRLHHAHDWWPAFAKFSLEERDAFLPLLVARPESVDEVAALLRAASAHDMAVVPYGAGSGVVGGVTVDRAHISLDLSGLNAIERIDEMDLHVTVGAGARAIEVEHALNDRGYTLGHYPQSLPLASCGGLVATRSSGTFSTLYGNIEELVLALEVVLADGTVVTERLTPRASTGPRIADLFIGSEGTLGIITKVSLRIAPLPERRSFRGLAFQSFGEGLESARQMMRSGVRPAVVRLYDAAESVHLFERGKIEPDGRCLLVLGFDGPLDLTLAQEHLALAICTGEGGEDLGAEIGEAWERGRFDASWLKRGNAGSGRIADAIEVSALWSALPGLHRAVREALAPETAVLWSHVSHVCPQGASIYFIVFLEDVGAAEVLERYQRVWASAMEATLEAGGAISHHHGIGRMRLPWIGGQQGSAREVLARVKRALDPENILTPGALGLDL